MGTIIHGVFYICGSIVFYTTGRMLLGLYGRKVESISDWWGRRMDTTSSKAAKKPVKETENVQDVLTVEYASYVGGMFWLCLLVFLPLGIWFAYTMFV